MSNPTFSVVIPTYHRNDLLAKCLDCLKPGVQTLAADQYEVIVTDDGRTTTAEHLIQEHYPWVTWVAGPQKGPAANRNNGARYAQGEWLAFTDDDCLPDPHWLQAYQQASAANPHYLVFEGRVYADRPRRSLAEKCPGNETGGYLWSCNFAVSKSLFNAMKGFDERFPYAAMEDVELKLRLDQAKQKIVFVKDASICHPWRKSGGWKEFRQHQYSTFIYLSIHPEERSRINSIYYLRYTLRAFLRTTIPGIFEFQGNGLRSAILEHISFLYMSCQVYLNQKLSKST